MTTLPNLLSENKYKVRFDMTMKGFAEIKKAGKIVEVVEFVAAETINTPTGKQDVSYLVRLKDGKLLPISYLQPRPPTELSNVLMKEIAKGFAYRDWRLGDGRWWMGRISPTEASGEFMAVSWNKGEFGVCQPPEWETGDHWAEFCLIVRSMTGDYEQILHEWRENEYFNLRFSQVLKHERPQNYDILPLSPPSPNPGYYCFTIRRTTMGEFFLETGKEFNSLEKLLDHYYTNFLPVSATGKKLEVNLSLRIPVDINLCPFSSPRPLIIPQQCPAYKRDIFKLIQSNEPNVDLNVAIDKKRVLKWKVACQQKEYATETKNETKERKTVMTRRDVTTRAYFHLNGSFKHVTIRQLVNEFNIKNFDRDMMFIHHAEGSFYNKNDQKFKAKQEKLCERIPSPKFRQGGNFLSQIMAYGKCPKPQESPGKKDEKEKKEQEEQSETCFYISYEGLPGLPLDRLLQKRRYEDRWTSMRCKLEVAYQVAGAMRFLEKNHLVHRHLRAANVCVYKEHAGSMSVKVTDYMVPYAFFGAYYVGQVELSFLEWPWFPPEVHFGSKEQFDISTDVWAFGCFIFELSHFGMTPYALENPPIQCSRDLIRFFALKKKMTTCHAWSDSYLDDLINLCMQVRTSSRPSFDYLFNFLRQLLYDMSIAPGKTIIDFMATNLPPSFKHFQHPIYRTEDESKEEVKKEAKKEVKKRK